MFCSRVGVVVVFPDNLINLMAYDMTIQTMKCETFDAGIINRCNHFFKFYAIFFH